MRNGCKSEIGLLQSEFNDSLKGRFARQCGESTPGGCIPWIGTKTTKGYGKIRLAGKGSRSTCAHRVAWVLERGDIKPEVLVLHRCDNPSCVNVEHLFLGSAKENTRDMVSKQRHFWRNPLPWQKLNAEDKERILVMRSDGYTQQQVADSFGVSRPLISMIEKSALNM